MPAARSVLRIDHTRPDDPTGTMWWFGIPKLVVHRSVAYIKYASNRRIMFWRYVLIISCPHQLDAIRGEVNWVDRITRNSRQSNTKWQEYPQNKRWGFRTWMRWITLEIRVSEWIGRLIEKGFRLKVHVSWMFLFL